MSYASTVDPAILALVAMLKASPDLADALVNDGQGLTDASWDDVICVGYVAPEEDTVAEGDAESAGLDSDAEAYDVHCAISTKIGDEDSWSEARARVTGYLETVGKIIKGDPRLRGTVSKARIGSWSLRQNPTTTGSYARMRFDVHVDAFTRR